VAYVLLVRASERRADEVAADVVCSRQAIVAVHCDESLRIAEPQDVAYPVCSEFNTFSGHGLPRSKRRKADHPRIRTFDYVWLGLLPVM